MAGNGRRKAKPSEERYPHELRCLKIAKGRKVLKADGECWNCPDMMVCVLIDDGGPDEKQYEDDRI
jgi:hypothetical protein